MGCGTWTTQSWDGYAKRTKIKGASVASDIYKSNGMKDKYNPTKFNFRESCDSAEHPNSTPIIIGLDVTGSMGGIITNVAKKLNEMVTEIYKRNPVSDPQICFNAIGDGITDYVPLQCTQFESDIRIAEQLTDLWFEGHGGGNGFESYPLTWWFAANKTKIDCYNKHGKKGFIFTMGDDGMPHKLTRSEIKKVFDVDPEVDISTEDLLDQVNRQYEVFHLMLMEGTTINRPRDKYKVDYMQSLLGERAIPVSDYTKIPEIIVSILETIGGKSVDEVVASWDGSTGVVVREALSGLTKVDKTESGLVEF